MFLMVLHCMSLELLLPSGIVESPGVPDTFLVNLFYERNYCLKSRYSMDDSEYFVNIEKMI
jgi:hypothetical protein